MLLKPGITKALLYITKHSPQGQPETAVLADVPNERLLNVLTWRLQRQTLCTLTGTALKSSFRFQHIIISALCGGNSK